VNRRRLLAVLGLGAAGGAGALEYTGTVDVDSRLEAAVTDLSEGDVPGLSDDETPGPTYESTTAALVDELPTEPVPAPSTFTFVSESVTFDELESDYFARVVADPSDSPPGDTLVVTPAEGREAAALAALLRDAWGVGSETTVETTVGDRTVELAGGRQGDTVALTGVVPASPSLVVVARAGSVTDATAVADELSV